MVKAAWLQHLKYFALYLLAFVIPLPYIYAAICIGLLTVTWFLQANFKEVFSNLWQRKPLLLWIAFFTWHALSYFWSDNQHQSLFDTQSKLSFLVLPIVIGAGFTLKRDKIEYLFLAFILGITLTACIAITNALLLWSRTHDLHVLFYHKLVDGFSANAVYEALYTLFSITLLLLMPWKFVFKGRFAIFRYLLLLFHIVFFILLSSKMLIALFFVLIIPIYIRKIFKHRKLSFLQISLIALVFIGTVTTLVTVQNPIRQRYLEVFSKGTEKAFLKDYHHVKEDEFTNLSLRVFMWRLGVENLVEHKLWWKGAGNGDIILLQNERMANYGINNIYNPDPEIRSPLYNVNLHNMFLQTLLMLGIPGLLIFVLIVFLPLFYLHKLLYGEVFFIFHIASTLFLIQEAALQTQAGIIYYTFFSIVFWNICYSSVKEKKILSFR